MSAEVIFIIVLIVFSLLEGALRKKKPPGAGLPPGGSRPQGWPLPDAEERGPRGVSAPPGRGGVEEGRPRETADQMVPDDIWEEIAALARGDVEETLRRRRQRAHQRPAPTRGPRPTQSLPSPPSEREARPSAEPPETSRVEAPPGSPSLPVPTPERRPRPIEVRSRAPRSREPRRIEVSRARGRETPAGAQPPVEAPPKAGADTPTTVERGRLSERRQARPTRRKPTHGELHHGFRGGHALRHAIIAREVLGRPLALREYGEEDLWSD